ncbi:MAG: SAM-dependent methyltransferase [Alphaproteobacteria bacterium]|nr:SAM-dependent methyltransferase [Alphaproteobacteria bacterium]
MSPSPRLAQRLRAHIARFGPITIEAFTRIALYDPEAGYYATRDDILGKDGDFITSPEVSQMFGELLGLWAAAEWTAIGAPAPVNLVELGAGRGLLMKDALRAIGKVAPAFREAAQVVFVEINPAHRALQAQADPEAIHVETLEEVPAGPTILLANEFLDCFPVRQLWMIDGAWRERLVCLDPETDGLRFTTTPHASPLAAEIPAALRDAPEYAIYEIMPDMTAFTSVLAARLHAGPGRALFIDYGHAAPRLGDTFQAMKRHEDVDPLEAAGEVDLTAHVDFARLADLATRAGLSATAAVTQGDFLMAIGLRARAERLKAAQPARAEAIERDLNRLSATAEMGELFKVMCISSPGLPPPAGFA